MPFNLKSPYQPSGDQPQAIKQLVAGIQADVARQTLLGVTGSGKTFTVANVIQQTQLPTLIISHNKTLAGQLYQEFKELFPDNKVSYFVSYYDYYMPESYKPSTDTYIAKEVDINDLIDKLRLEATSNIFSGDDNIVIASVSCIYNIGDPTVYSGKTIDFALDQSWPRRQLFETLVSLYYTRSEIEFKRGTFRVRGSIVEIWPAYQDWILVLDFDNNRLSSIIQRYPLTNREINTTSYRLFPAKQYVGGQNDNQEIFKRIRQDCQKQVEVFKSQHKMLEAHRIQQRVEYDLEMLAEVGYINGIENYSIYFEGNRRPGDPPYTLVDYFRHRWGDNFLTIIDESHVTIPQIGGMYHGDVARKKNLVDFGFRLPASFDNRPLKFEEFYQRISHTLFLSATPADFEIKESSGHIVEQLIRPTNLVDPPIDIRPSKSQIPDLVGEIIKRKNDGQRTLVVTLTKRMAEELSSFLSEPKNTTVPLKVAYLHADIDTLERSTILDDLRNGTYDVLVGINLLREGLDLPEVSLVAILDAGQQGFLRSRASLIQIMGRASRHLAGQVILYSDTISPAMRQAIDEVTRRRKIQLQYNQDHNLTPQSVTKSIRPKIIETPIDQSIAKPKVDPSQLTPKDLTKYLKDLRKQMRNYATTLDFENAIRIRDQITKLESKKISKK